MTLWTMIRLDFKKFYLFPIKHLGKIQNTKKIEKEKEKRKKRKLGFYLLFSDPLLVDETLFFWGSFYLLLSHSLSFNFDISNQNLTFSI